MYAYQMSVVELTKCGLSEAEAKRYKKVVSEYRKAKALFEKLKEEREEFENRVRYHGTQEVMEKILKELSEI